MAPENTLAGLAIAARLGCVAVEFDTMLSADGVPVLIHDENLLRTAGTAQAVADSSVHDLTHTDVGRYFHPAFSGECVPTLEAALADCVRLGLAANVEIKPSTGRERETGRIVGEQLARLGPHQRLPVLLSSFAQEALEAVAQTAPALPRALLAEGFVPALLEQAQALGCVAIHLSRRGLQAHHVAQVHAAGLKCSIYTVNTLAEAMQLQGWGVDQLFSDRPDLLLGAVG